jgi:hypothetical protein
MIHHARAAVAAFFPTSSAGAAALAVLCVAAGTGAPPAAAQNRLTPIQYGQQVQGALAASDVKLPDDSYIDEYVFRGRSGDQVTISMRSAAFDPYLALGAYPDGRTWQGMATDDDGGGGTDARISFTLPADGLYVIRANSVEVNEQGAYTLQVAGPRTSNAAAPGPRPAPAQSAAPPARPSRPASLPTGRYRCYQALGYYTYMGMLDVTGATTYRFGGEGSQRPGTLRYDRASGRITFGPGPLPPSRFSGQLGVNGNDGRPQITLSIKDSKGRESEGHCSKQ